MWAIKENKAFIIKTLQTAQYEVKQRIFKDNGEKIVTFSPKNPLFPSAETQNGETFILFNSVTCTLDDAEKISESLQALIELIKKEKEGLL